MSANPAPTISPAAAAATIIPLPETGSFNGSLAQHASLDGRFICVYRSTNRDFALCELTADLSPILSTHTPLNLHGRWCVDPRLLWHRNRLWLLFSTPSGDDQNEDMCIAELRIHDRTCGPIVCLSRPGTGRQKNWMPFSSNGTLFVISDVRPHTVLEVQFEHDQPQRARLVAQTAWDPPNDRWLGELRGNTNALRISEDYFLGTFHCVTDRSGVCHYDNGCYLFSASPPFSVSKCSRSPYLSSLDATTPHLRRKGQVAVTFPMSLVESGNELLISYGDNDSSLKVLRTTVRELLSLMDPLS